MADVVDKKTRSRMMSGIRGKNTRPELLIRSELHKRGFRFRLHYGQLPGKPDLVLPKYNAVILVNGCFWHGHNCHLFKWPSTREEFWRNKIQSNQVRDESNIDEYAALGWKTLVVWECALKGRGRHDLGYLVDKIDDWLKTASGNAEISGMDPSAGNR